jgi:hypothetical protein
MQKVVAGCSSTRHDVTPTTGAADKPGAPLSLSYTPRHGCLDPSFMVTTSMPDIMLTRVSLTILLKGLPHHHCNSGPLSLPVLVRISPLAVREKHTATFVISCHLLAPYNHKTSTEQTGCSDHHFLGMLRRQSMTGSTASNIGHVRQILSPSW